MATLPAPKVKIRELIAENKTKPITENTTQQELLEITDKRVELLWNKVNNPTNNPRMMLLEEKKLLKYHEVYIHKEENGTIVYVGEGIFGRDGDCLARRDHKHSRWMLEQVFKNREYAETVETGLTKEEAIKKEKELIEKYQPIFNRKGKIKYE